MDIVQNFYDSMAPQYDKLFQDWDADSLEQAEILDRLFSQNGFDRSARILDCACGIGTQAIGLALLGYPVTASDLSTGALKEAEQRAQRRGAAIRFAQADFRALAEVFPEQYDIVTAMDNALPHMLTDSDLSAAVRSIAERTKQNGIIVLSIRDYDSLLQSKPECTAPYIRKTAQGQRVSLQTWDWKGENYHFVQYIIDDTETVHISRFECEYRAVRRAALTELFISAGCRDVQWKNPEETGFYQPVAIIRK